MMGGIIGICVALFGVFWTVLAASGGAGIMVPFGIIFIIIAVVQVIYNFKNATGKNRYSQFDITDENEEPDPLNEKFGADGNYKRSETGGSRYGPYCGAKAGTDFEFCKECGRKLP